MCFWESVCSSVYSFCHSGSRSLRCPPREANPLRETNSPPLLWVWSGHREKGSSEKTKVKTERAKAREGAQKCEQKWSQVQCVPTLPLPSSIRPRLSSLHLSSLHLFAFTLCSHLHAFPRLTVEINRSITECTYNIEFNSSLLRKDLAFIQSIYPWENPRTQLQLALKHT